MSAVKWERLRRREDIRRVYSARRMAHGRLMSVHLGDGEPGKPSRFAVVAGRDVGKAVRRNRAKRRLRALLGEDPTADGFDAVVVAREALLAAPFEQARRELSGLLEKASRGPRVPR